MEKFFVFDSSNKNYGEELKGRTVLVTGASGFTGRVLVKKLLSVGAKIKAIARTNSNLDGLSDLGIQWIRGDVYDPDVVNAAIQGVEYVFHVAASFRQAKIEDIEYYQVHVESTKLLAQAAKLQTNFKRFIHISTMGVHGHIENPPGDENSPYAPGDEYQRTKLEAEIWINEFAKANSLPFTIIRPTGIYGPGDKRLLKVFKMATMKFYPILGSGQCLYHLIHVEDLCSAIIKAAITESALGETFLIGNEEPIKLEDVVKIVSGILKTKPRSIRLPAAPFFILGMLCEAICRPLGIEPPIYRRRVAFFTKDRAYNTSKMRDKLGYFPKYSNREGIIETTNWYKKEGWLKVVDQNNSSVSKKISPVSFISNSTNRPKKILVILPQPFFAVRGSSMRARCTVELLAELGFEVHLLTFPQGEVLNLSGVKNFRSMNLPFIRSVPIGPSWNKLILDFFLFISALKLNFKHRYDIFHGIEEGAFFAMFISKISSKSYVFDMHSWMSEQLKDRENPWLRYIAKIMKSLEDSAIKKSAGVITVADKITEYAKSIDPKVPAITIQDAPLQGLTSVSYDAASKIREKLRADSHLYLYTGNFYQYQGMELMIEAFGVFLNKLKAKNAFLMIVGGDPETEIDSFMRLKKLVRKLNIENFVIFEGQKSVSEMGNYLAAADFLVSPRITGGNTPLKIYSYMASKKPILATNILTHCQVLDDSCAFLFNPNVEDFANGMRKISEADQSQIRKVTELAEKRVALRFSRDCFKNGLSELYSQIGTEID